MSDTKPKLFLFAVIRTKPEYFDAAKAALDHLMPLTREERGCHMFAAFENKDEADTLHLFECFDDEDALSFHYAQDYTASVFKKYEDWLASPVEVTRMSATSRASWEQVHG